MSLADQLKFNAEGLVPAVVQDHASGRVLMLAWMNRTAVERTLETGRTHQIRVHLGFVGCPVLADRLYSGRDRFLLSDLVPHLSREQDEVLIGRQALHAFRLRFRHPRTGEWIEVEAPLAPDIRRTLEALRAHRPVRR